MHRSLDIDQATLAGVCQRHQVRRLSLFGSQLKGTAGPGSDIDLLVEFDPDAHPTLLDLAQIEIELSQALGGKKVDVRTPEDLSRFFRSDVLRMAEVQYVSG
ncbi:MAG: nucleotidyltransferase domain-containing protein [Chromatiaceae bacterium]